MAKAYVNTVKYEIIIEYEIQNPAPDQQADRKIDDVVHNIVLIKPDPATLCQMSYHEVRDCQAQYVEEAVPADLDETDGDDCRI